MWTLWIALIFGCGDAEQAQGPEPTSPVVPKAKSKAKTKAKSKAKAKKPPPEVEKTSAKVFFLDKTAVESGKGEAVVSVDREVGVKNPPRNAIWTLFKGPEASEAEAGLMLAKSGATGFEGLTVEDGVATLKLKGGCSNEGGVHSIYDLIVPTLKQFDEIDAVKVLDPEGETQNPDGKGDSRPACLEP